MRHPEDSGESGMTTGEEAKHTSKTTATGATAGGVIGALLVPRVGPVLACELLVSVLSGAAVGAAAGGLVGALDGLGIPEDEARFAEHEFQQGRIILTVHAGAMDVTQILHECGGYNMHTKSVGSEGNVPNMAHPEASKPE